MFFNSKKINLKQELDFTLECQNKRTFLLLQGPHGSFFKELSKSLYRIGYEVHSICFNGGDAVDKFYTPNTHYFSQPRECWSNYFNKFIKEKNVTDVIIYGDRRYYHSTAIGLCKLKEINIWIFEEGYLRPGYVTLEKFGVNSKSQIPNIYISLLNKELKKANLIDATQLDNLKIDLDNILKDEEITSDKILPNPMKTRVKTTVSNYTWLFFLYLLFPFYKWHRGKGFNEEIFGWGLKKLRDSKDISINKYINEKFIDNANCKYFAFPLQLNSDAQIKCASSFRDVSDAIECVIFSFAKYATEDIYLIIKIHPLDNSFFSYKNFVNKLASALNISDRVLFVSDSINYVKNSIGMIVVNSTMGIISLSNLKPTITLGNAIYAGYGLATSSVTNGIFNENILNKFWQNPIKPKTECVNLFFRVLRKYALVPGNFYTQAGIEQTIIGTLKKFGIKGIKNCIFWNKRYNKGIKKIRNIDIFLENIQEKSVIGWGHKNTAQKARLYAQKNNIPYIALEDGFIKSVNSNHFKENDIVFSLVMDRIGIYYDATEPSELEHLINTSQHWFDQNMMIKTQQLIKLIVENEIVKYNLFDPNEIKLNILDHDITDNSVLVIDQTYNDTSILKGNANKNTFKIMLKEAIDKYGASHVFVKLHPAVVAGKRKGNYTISELNKLNVKILKENCNSIQLLKKFKNVYVVTSGTGFEALMCGCNVTCFGEPFYSGYGLTTDKQNTTHHRRISLLHKPIKLEHLVAAVYYKYSIFINPYIGQQCDPETVINQIIKIKNNLLTNQNLM